MQPAAGLKRRLGHGARNASIPREHVMIETNLPGKTAWESQQYRRDHGHRVAAAQAYRYLARRIETDESYPPGAGDHGQQPDFAGAQVRRGQRPGHRVGRERNGLVDVARHPPSGAPGGHIFLEGIDRAVPVPDPGRGEHPPGQAVLLVVPGEEAVPQLFLATGRRAGAGRSGYHRERRPSTTRSSNAYFPPSWVGGETLSPSPPAGTSFTIARSADIPPAQELNNVSQSSFVITEFVSLSRTVKAHRRAILPGYREKPGAIIQQSLPGSSDCTPRAFE